MVCDGSMPPTLSVAQGVGESTYEAEALGGKRRHQRVRVLDRQPQKALDS